MFLGQCFGWNSLEGLDRHRTVNNYFRVFSSFIGGALPTEVVDAWAPLIRETRRYLRDTRYREAVTTPLFVTSQVENTSESGLEPASGAPYHASKLLIIAHTTGYRHCMSEFPDASDFKADEYFLYPVEMLIGNVMGIPQAYYQTNMIGVVRPRTLIRPEVSPGTESRLHSPAQRTYLSSGKGWSVCRMATQLAIHGTSDRCTRASGD